MHCHHHGVTQYLQIVVTYLGLFSCDLVSVLQVVHLSLRLNQAVEFLYQKLPMAEKKFCFTIGVY